MAEEENGRDMVGREEEGTEEEEREEEESRVEISGEWSWSNALWRVSIISER